MKLNTFTWALALAMFAIMATMPKIASAEEDNTWTHPLNWDGPSISDSYSEWSANGTTPVKPGIGDYLSGFFRGHGDAGYSWLSGIGDSRTDEGYWSYGGRAEIGLRFNRSRESGASWKCPVEISALYELTSLHLDGTGYDVQERLHLFGGRLRLWSPQSSFYIGLTGWYPSELEEKSVNIDWRNGIKDLWATLDVGFAGETWSMKFEVGYPRSMARLDVVLDQGVNVGFFISGYSWGCPWDGGEHKLRLTEGVARTEYLYQRYWGEIGFTWSPWRLLHVEAYFRGGVSALDPTHGGIDPPDYSFWGAGLRISWNIGF